MWERRHRLKKSGCSILAVICCLLMMLVTAAQAAEKQAETVWRLDAKPGAVFPRSLRLMTDEFTHTLQAEPSRQGLDTLRCSASAEFSGSGLAMIRDKIRTAAGSNAVIYVVDLRKESHGFVNGDIPVSRYTKKNLGNYNLKAADVEKAEKNDLQSLVGKETTFVPLGKTDTKLFGASTVKVEQVETEKDVASRLGMRYKRIPIADQTAPNDEDIDAFVKFYKKLPANAWLHFHCHAGHGRTTTFAVFYDILSNPAVALDDIVARQYALGGTNLFIPSKKDNWKGKEIRKRAEQIRKFYAYVQANRSNQYAQTFSAWVKTQR
ncbi:phosphatase domain-containing putative toxin [Selenomonas ruminantium]|uniref:Inositol hexakisphosphate n=1 Tax=Selenomonas ruminantium TaxID=971 RepID=A0A1I0V0A6_SELRU|nr:hypothetical protein [Selenomonas ruminantium]SFA68966.1 Inositol hexakisphosphate [Selenomonas ruminantium]